MTKSHTNHLIDSVQIIEENGKTLVQLDLSVWQEIVALLQTPSPPETKTDLGRALRQARVKVVASGQPLLDEKALEMEIQARRGGQG